MKSLVVNASLDQEGVGSDDLGHLRARSHNYRSRKTKVADNPGFDLPAQRNGGSLASLEHYISALDVSLHLLEAQAFERLSQGVHLDSLVSNVDSAEH